jgi:hypothetical protein
MTTRKLKVAGRVLVALAVAALGNAWAAAPDVLTQVPADATLAIVVGNLKNTSTKTSNLALRLNIAQKTGIPVPPDLVGFASRMLGITKGLDPNGSAAMVLLKATPDGPPGPPPMVLLLPTTDAPGMLEGFSPGAADASGIQEVTLPQNQEKGYVAPVAGKYVAFARDKDALAGYLKHTDGIDKGLPAPEVAAFENNDAVLWINMDSVRPMAEGALSQAAQLMQVQMAAANANRDPFSSALQREVAQLYLEGLSAVVRDSSHFLVTAKLSDAGVAAGFSASLKEGSELAKFVAAQKAGAAPTLAGLPSGDLLMAASFHLNGAALQEPLQAVVDRILSNPDIKDDPKAAALRQSADMIKQSLALVQGAKMVLLNPGDPSKGFIKGAMLLDTTDAAKYMDLMRAQYQNTQAIEAMMSMSPDLQMKQTFTPDALTVQGVKFFKIQVTPTLREETPDKPLAPGSREGFQMLSAMYGPDGLTTYMAPVGNQVLAVIGSDEANVAAALSAAQAKKDDLGTLPALAATQKELVANPIGMVYMPVGKWAALVTRISGRPVPPGMDALEKSPPIAISFGINGAMATEEIFLPTTTLSTFIDVAAPRRRVPAEGGAMP